MAISAIIGGQWGDEGKGKVVDLLSSEVDVVARYQGGANAGHTVYKDNQKIVLHQIPSGIMRDDCKCLLGNGMVIDPIELVEEFENVQSKGLTINNIFISMNAHITSPIHKLIDVNSEKKSNNKIGTTGKGIGPTYVDKYNRKGIRSCDLLDNENLKSKIEKQTNRALSSHQISTDDLNSIKNELDVFFKACNTISKHITEESSTLYDSLFFNVPTVVLQKNNYLFKKKIQSRNLKFSLDEKEILKFIKKNKVEKDTNKILSKPKYALQTVKNIISLN